MENKYEYFIYECTYKSDDSELLETLNDLGSDGWEMVSAQLKPLKNEKTNSYDVVYTFKKIL